MNISEKTREWILSLSRRTLCEITGSPVPDPAKPEPEDLPAGKPGLFVTLKKKGELRGCIGLIRNHYSLVEAIKKMTKAAALEDPRFHPVVKNEISDIVIEISLLSELEPVENPEEIIPGTHGLYLVYRSRSGLLLPQVATEQGWNRIQFLNYTARKAGLPEDTWQNKEVELWKFTATIFNEKNKENEKR